MRTQSKIVRKQKPVAEIVVMFLLASAIVGMALVLNSQNEIFATPRQQRGERSSVTLPPLQSGANLFFVTTDSATLYTSAIDEVWDAVPSFEVIRPSDAEELIAFGDENLSSDSSESETGHDNTRMLGQSFLSPDGRYIAMNVHTGPLSVVWVIDLKDKANPEMFRLVTEGFGRFLAWHPDSQHVLYLAYDLMVSNPGLWMVDIVGGSHQRIEISTLVTPQNLTAAAISPDGAVILYATTQGMGTGSELWKMEDQQTHRRIWGDQQTVIGSLSYSPDGQFVALVNLLDSPVPFANAGLWKIDALTSSATFLTTMDGGHGQSPIWSNNSNELYFVKRDNPDEIEANYNAKSLVSSVRAIDVNNLTERVVVPADGARQLDLSLAPNGDLMFASDRGDVLEVWTVSSDGHFQQVTADGQPKRFPLIVVLGR